MRVEVRVRVRVRWGLGSYYWLFIVVGFPKSKSLTFSSSSVLKQQQWGAAGGMCVGVQHSKT